MAAESEFEPHAGDEHILTDSGQASCEMAAESEFEPHACTTLGEGGGVRGNSPLLNFCHATTPGLPRGSLAGRICFFKSLTCYNSGPASGEPGGGRSAFFLIFDMLQLPGRSPG